MADIADILTPVPATEGAAPAQDAWVNVLNPQGELVSVPQTHLNDALNNGFSEASPELVAKTAKEAELQAKYGSSKDQAQAFTEGAIKGMVGPLAAPLERAYGQRPGGEKEFNESLLGHEEANPVASGLGEASGFVGSALTGVGQAGLLSKAGEGLETGLNLSRATRLAQAGTEATRAAFEGVLYQAGNELHKKFLDDPNQTAESAIANMGISGVLTGLFGGAIGAALKPLAEGVEQPFVSQAEHAALDAGDVKAATQVSELFKPAEKNKILEAFKISKEKPEAGAYKSAAKDLDLPIPSGSTLASPYVERSIYALSKNPYTVAGHAVSENLENAWSRAGAVLEDAAKSEGGGSVEEFGNKAREYLKESITSAYKPQKEAFDAISALHEIVPLHEDLVAGLSKSLRDIKEVRLDSKSAEGILVRGVLRAAERAKTAEDITTLHNSALLKDLSSPTGKDPMAYIKSIVKDKLLDIQETAVERYARAFPRNDEAGAYTKSLIDGFRAQKQNVYKPYIQKLSTLTEWLGKGKIHGTADALHFLENRFSGTDLTAKLTRQSKDPEFVRFLEKNFPELHAMVRDQARGALHDKAEIAGQFSPKKFFTNFSDLEPEVKNALYTADEIKKIDKLDTYYKNAFPKDFNPSGTASHAAFLDAHTSPNSLIRANIRDTTIKKVIDWAARSAEGKQAIQLAEATVKGDKLASNVIKGIFDKVKEVPKSIVPSIAARAKLDKLVESYAKDPAKMVAMNDNNTSVPEYTQAFGASAARVVQYLGALKPKTNPKAPLDRRRPANSVEKSAYERALDIAEQPLVVLKALGEGRLTSKDVTALKTMYPSLYKALGQKMSEAMADSVNKGKPLPYPTRMGLSLFLGQALDSTMTPASITAIQTRHASPSHRPDEQAAKAPSAAGMKGLQKLPGMAQTPGQQREMSRATGKH